MGQCVFAAHTDMDAQVGGDTIDFGDGGFKHIVVGIDPANDGDGIAEFIPGDMVDIPATKQSFFALK